jgi:hypothetical protein
MSEKAQQRHKEMVIPRYARCHVIMPSHVLQNSKRAYATRSVRVKTRCFIVVPAPPRTLQENVCCAAGRATSRPSVHVRARRRRENAYESRATAGRARFVHVTLCSATSAMRHALMAQRFARVAVECLCCAPAAARYAAMPNAVMICVKAQDR